MSYVITNKYMPAHEFIRNHNRPSTERKVLSKFHDFVLRIAIAIEPISGVGLLGHFYITRVSYMR